MRGSKEFRANYSYGALLERLIATIWQNGMEIAVRISISEEAEAIGARYPAKR